MYTLKFDVRKFDASYPFGLFRASVFNGTKLIKSKDANLSKHSCKSAYEFLEATALEWSKVYTITTFNKPTLAEMKADFSDKVNKAGDAPAKKDDTLTDIFGHAGKFKSAVKAAYSNHGYAKIATILGSSMDLLGEIHEPVMKKAQAFADANIAMAWSLYRVTLSTGVDMSEKCFDVNVKRLYLGHFDEDGKIKTYYVLNGERWDGLGNPPVEFKKWAQDNNKDNYDELLLKGCDHG